MKESSDELNPPVLTSGVSIARARRGRTPKDYLALALATCGVGYLPLAPGTWGSIVGVGIYLLLHKASSQASALAQAHAWRFPALEEFHASLSWPIITSLSTRFFGQPRLINPTFFISQSVNSNQ